MNPKEISDIIEKEIEGNWSVSNMHGCDLKSCLIRPKKRSLRFSGVIKDAWIVLEENPLTLDGYKIFYDKENKNFGLAGYAEPYCYVCNTQQNFLDAFKSM